MDFLSILFLEAVCASLPNITMGSFKKNNKQV